MGDKAIRIAESTTDNLADYGKPKCEIVTLTWSELNNKYKITDIADINTDEAESMLATQDAKERLAVLKLSTPDSHIIDVGFRSDYDRVDRPNVTFFLCFNQYQREDTLMSELGQWFKVTYQSGLVLPSDRLVTLIPVTHVGEAGHETKYREEQVPNWVRERVSLLRLVEPGTDIGGVGKRHSKEVFFIKRENSL